MLGFTLSITCSFIFYICSILSQISIYILKASNLSLITLHVFFIVCNPFTITKENQNVLVKIFDKRPVLATKPLSPSFKH